MIKKIISVLMCAFILLSLIPFTASAAESAAYKLRIVEQTDKSVTVSFDFVSGSGFSAFDFDIIYEKIKLTYVSHEKGSGYRAFANSSDMAQQVVNPKAGDNCIKVAMIAMPSFEKKGNDGSILVVTFSKIPGAKISEGDIKVVIENCQNSNFTNIATSISYDLTAPVQNSNTPTENNGNNNGGKVEYEQGSSIKNGNDSEIGEAVNNGQPGNSNAGVENPQQGSAGAVAGSNSESGANGANSEASSAVIEKGATNKTKSIIIIAVAVLGIAGIGAVVLIIIKNKKKPENQI